MARASLGAAGVAMLSLGTDRDRADGQRQLAPVEALKLSGRDGGGSSETAVDVPGIIDSADSGAIGSDVAAAAAAAAAAAVSDVPMSARKAVNKGDAGKHFKVSLPARAPSH